MAAIDVLIVESDPEIKTEMCDLVAKAGLTFESCDRLPVFESGDEIQLPHCVIAAANHFEMHSKNKTDRSDDMPVLVGVGDKSSFRNPSSLDLILSDRTPKESLVDAARCLIVNRKNEIRFKSQIHSFNERLSKITRLETLGMLASEFSHDVKNFSFVAEYNSAKLEKTLKESHWDEKIEKRLLSIRSNIDRISALAKQILDYSQENDDLDWELQDVHVVLEDVLGYFGFGSNKKSPTLHKSFAQDSFKIKALRLDLLRLFLNLLNNAREAVESQQDSWVKIETTRFNNYVRIRIVDSGEGIPQVFQDRIMTPFFTTKKETQGTGIGLSIAKEIVEKYQGKLFVDRSVPNTCFCVELPLEPEV